MTAGPAPYSRRKHAERAHLAGIVFDLSLQGLSTRKIEEATKNPHGPTGGVRIPATTARDMIREEIDRRIDPRVDEYRALELARLEAALERLHNMEESVRTVMARKHITVNNGRVIKAINPETMEEEPVEDDTFILQAVDRLNRIEESRRRTSESIRRLLGLDAPAKTEQQVTQVTQADIELGEMIREAKAKIAVEEQNEGAE